MALVTHPEHERPSRPAAPMDPLPIALPRCDICRARGALHEDGDRPARLCRRCLQRHAGE